MVTTKLCGKCNEKKPHSKFSRRNDGRYQSWCGECNTAYQHEWYIRNNTKHRKSIVLRKARIRKEKQEFVAEYFKTHFCVVCGESDSRVLEFDHLDRKTKKANISNLVYDSYSLEIVKEEISKCQVMCANCYRRKTFEERTTVSINSDAVGF